MWPVFSITDLLDDIGANVSSPGPYLEEGSEITIGSGVDILESASRVLGDSLYLKDNAQVYDVYYNELDGLGDVLGQHHTPAQLPLVSAFADVPSFTAGTQDLEVPQNGSLMLDAGSYGMLLADMGSTVTFTGGVYDFGEWDVREDVHLHFQAPSQIRITGKLAVAQGSYLGPGPGSTGLDARDIVIYVTGINGSNDNLSAAPKAAKFGMGTTAEANVYVPNGTLWLRQNRTFTGAFLGKWMILGIGASAEHLSQWTERTGGSASVPSVGRMRLASLSRSSYPGQFSPALQAATDTPTPTPTDTPTPTATPSPGNTPTPISTPTSMPPAGLMTTTVIDCTYDLLYRLTAADYPTGGFFHYTYDAVGNRLTQDTLAGTNTYLYDIANRLIEVDGVPYTWDDRGNLLDDGVRTYSYVHANRLSSVVQGPDAYTFAYNGLGDRLRQSLNGAPVEYTLDISNWLSEVLRDDTNLYLYGIGRIAEVQPGDWEYHLGDAIGSVRELVNSSGTLLLPQGFDPFGNLVTALGGGRTPYGFTAAWTDAPDLIHLRTRSYAPGDGRFISRDQWRGEAQTPLSLNGWLYLMGNPVNSTDPSGTGLVDFGLCFTLHTLLRGNVPLVSAEQAVSLCRNAFSQENWQPVFDCSEIPPGRWDPPETVRELFRDYVCENGPDYVVFQGSEPLTRQLATSTIVDCYVRDKFYDAGPQPRTFQRINEAEFALGWLDQRLWNLIPVSEFVGSFWYTAVELAGDRVGFRIDNDTSLEPGSHFPGRFPSEGFTMSMEQENREISAPQACGPIGYRPGTASPFHPKAFAQVSDKWCRGWWDNAGNHMFGQNENCIAPPNVSLQVWSPRCRTFAIGLTLLHILSQCEGFWVKDNDETSGAATLHWVRVRSG